MLRKRNIYTNFMQIRLIQQINIISHIMSCIIFSMFLRKVNCDNFLAISLGLATWIVSRRPTPRSQTPDQNAPVSDGMILRTTGPCRRKHRPIKNNTPTVAFHIWQLFAGRIRCQLTRRGRRCLVSQKKRKIILWKTWENFVCKVTKDEKSIMPKKFWNEHGRPKVGE